MTAVGFCVLLCSAFIHASWNYLSKKADGGVPFIWLFTAIAAVVYTPLAIGVAIYEKPEIGIWQLVIIMASILAHLGFFLFFKKGTKRAIFPSSIRLRGDRPAAYLRAGGRLFGETLTLPAIIGILLIVISILFYRGVKRLKEPGSFTPILYGLAVGCIIAAYTLLDKAAVSRFLIPPLLLDYCNTLGRLIILTPFAAKSWSEVRFEWKHHRMEAVGVGVFNSLAYILALSVMVFAPVSYVAPIREISILIGTVMGAVLLSEGFGRLRIIAAVFMVLGVISVAVG
ncbi:DMT family transporter [Bacillus licheniformis]